MFGIDGVEQTGARSEQLAPWRKCQVGASEIYLLCCDGGIYCEEAEPVGGWMNETGLSVRSGAAVVQSVPQESSQVKPINASCLFKKIKKINENSNLCLCEFRVSKF